MEGLGLAYLLAAHGAHEHVGGPAQVLESLHVRVDVEGGKIDRVLEVAALPKRAGDIQTDHQGRLGRRRVLGRGAPKDQRSNGRYVEGALHAAPWGTAPRAA